MPQTISRGAHGSAVRELQGNLRAKGAQLKVDGIFGPATDKAVREFQSARHMHSDGIVGHRTWSALHGVAAIRRHVPEKPVQRDWTFEQMLKDAGAWIEDHNPFGSAAPVTHPVPTRARTTTPTPRPAPMRTPAQTAAHNKTPRVTLGADGNRFRRISFDGYEGRGWIIKNFTDMRGKQVREFRNGTFAVNPVGGKRFGVNECAHLVKYYGVPYTGTWRRGPQVCHMKAGELPVGTVIATLRDGSYHSDYSGRSHVGIYLGHDDYGAYTASGSKTAGVLMLNQWNGVDVQTTKRPYWINADAIGKKSKEPWKDDAGRTRTRRLNWMNDGEEYFVVMTK